MVERYVQLAEDLQYAKKQLAKSRQKVSLLQIDLETSQEQIKQLKMTIEKLNDLNSKLSSQNKRLQVDKQSIITGYSSEVESIKDEIAQKERYIYQLKQQCLPGNISQKLVQKQIRHQIEEQFKQSIENKQKQINDLSSQISQLNYQRQLEREKMGLKISTLESTIKELNNQHLTELEEYSKRLYHQTQVKPNDDKESLRRAKREIDELRKRFELVNDELAENNSSKSKLHKQFTKWMEDHTQYVNQTQEEIRLYKLQIQKLTEIIERNSRERDNYLLKEKDRQIKKLREDIEEIHDQIKRKDKKIGDLEVASATHESEMIRVKSMQGSIASEAEQKLKFERDKYLRQLHEVRQNYERIKLQNRELTDSLFEMSKNTINDNRKRMKVAEEAYAEEKEVQLQKEKRKRLMKQTSETQLPNLTTNNQFELADAKRHQQAFVKEQIKLKQMIRRYADLKKQHEKAEKKLSIANQKIVELLKNKIELGSPKAVNKKIIEFPTQPKQTTNSQTYIHENHTNKRHNHFDDSFNIRNDKNSSHSPVNRSPSPLHHGHSHTDMNFRSNAQGYRVKAHDEFRSPQQNGHIRIEETSVQSKNERSFYERSLKIKTGFKYRELKCTNHEQQQ